MAPAKLDREMIVEAALALLEEEGIDGVSLRKVAAAVGARAPSLYWHVNDKQALFGLMSEALFRQCLAQLPECDDWQSWLRSLGIVLWRTHRQIRDIRPLMIQSSFEPGVLQQLTDLVCDPLIERGIEPTLAFDAQRSVQALVTGWTMLAYDPKTIDVPVDPSFLRSLDILVHGWEQATGSQGR